MPDAVKENLLNIEVGKREADAIYARRDRAEARRRWLPAIEPAPTPPLADWAQEAFEAVDQYREVHRGEENL